MSTQPDYYADKLKEGQEFQDYCSVVFHQKLGIVISNFQSRRYQIDRGENIQGIEIKRDSRFRETGNLYIEVAEKSNPSRAEFVASGFERGDNSWLYAIGDERTIWIFNPKWLRHVCGSKTLRRVQIPTSIGYLLPVELADKCCIHRIDIDVQ
jgi:hypothetical protein